MRFWLYLAIFLTGISAAGCGAQVSKADLGTVIFELPKIPGVEEPYQMPQLDQPDKGGDEAGAARLP
jgi:hypothetical protein